MHEQDLEQPEWRGVRFIKGLLGAAPAVSLQLDPFEEELYADDVSGKPIEDLVPDYSILDHIQYEYPVRDAYFTYASRGCVRKCAFCGVPKLEGGQRDTNSLTEVVSGVNRLYGEKRDLILMDNNVVASSNLALSAGQSSNVKVRRCSAGSTSIKVSMPESSARMRCTCDNCRALR